jgi:hypothetical protein
MSSTSFGDDAMLTNHPSYYYSQPKGIDLVAGFIIIIIIMKFCSEPDHNNIVSRSETSADYLHPP